MTSTTKHPEWDKGFSQGYACACANYIRNKSVDSHVYDMYNALFMSEDQLKEHEVDGYDIEALLPLIKEIEADKTKDNDLY